MKVRARQEWGTAPVEIGGLTITVREKSPADDQRFLRTCRSKVVDPKTQEVSEQTDFAKLWRARIAHMIVRIDGLTPERIDALAPLETGSDEELDLPDEVGGMIPFDATAVAYTGPDGTAHTLSEYLWMRAPAAKFAAIITKVAENLALYRAALEEAQKKTF